MIKTGLIECVHDRLQLIPPGLTATYLDTRSFFLPQSVFVQQVNLVGNILLAVPAQTQYVPQIKALYQSEKLISHS